MIDYPMGIVALPKLALIAGTGSRLAPTGAGYIGVDSAGTLVLSVDGGAFATVGGGGGGGSSRTVTSSTTLLVTDTVIFVDSSAAPVVLTLPSAAAFLNKQLQIIHTVPDNLLTIDPPGAETLQGAADVMLAGDGTIRSVTILSNGIAYFIA